MDVPPIRNHLIVYTYNWSHDRRVRRRQEVRRICQCCNSRFDLRGINRRCYLPDSGFHRQLYRESANNRVHHSRHPDRRLTDDRSSNLGATERTADAPTCAYRRRNKELRPIRFRVALDLFIWCRREAAMQGQILSVAVTNNQGLILGDDGMTLHFHATKLAGQLSESHDRDESGVHRRRSVRGETRTLSARRLTRRSSAPIRPFHQLHSCPECLRILNRRLGRLNSVRALRQCPSDLIPRRPRPAVIAATPEARAEARQIRKTVGLLCFLGVIGVFIAHCYIGTRMTAGTVLLFVFFY